MRSHEHGRDGEERAAAYLCKKGLHILARNFRTRRGEVDIVAEADGRIVFVEVKAWRAAGPADLERSISLRKQRRIAGAARVFLHQHRQSVRRGEWPCRFDVVLLQSDGAIRHIEGAFDSPWPG